MPLAEIEMLFCFHVDFWNHFNMEYFSSKDLEQSAKEQDKESEKQLLLQEVENHKKQLLR